MPKIIPQFTGAKVSKAGWLNKEDLKKMGVNILKFTAPSLAVFFTQLQMGVEPKAAALVALLILYGLIADYLKKLNNGGES